MKKLRVRWCWPWRCARGWTWVYKDIEDPKNEGYWRWYRFGPFDVEWLKGKELKLH